MQLIVSELREIVKKFMKEQFNVDNFRISYAMPSEVNKTWALFVSYSIEPPSEFGNLKHQPKFNIAKACYVIVNDEKNKFKDG
jgi:hypothetical protein